jgi:hypothetical protein
VLETRIQIFELCSLRLLHTLETAPNRLGLADMCADSERCHVVLPAAGVGQVRKRWATCVGLPFRAIYALCSARVLAGASNMRLPWLHWLP